MFLATANGMNLLNNITECILTQKVYDFNINMMSLFVDDKPF